MFNRGTTSGRTSAPPPGRRAEPPQGGDQGGGGYRRGGDDGEGGEKASWVKAAEFYDSWHSAMEVGVKAEFYRHQLTIKLDPVELGKEGESYEIKRGESRYNRSEGLIAVLKPEHVVVLAKQLRAVLGGLVSQTTLALGRDEGKRLRLDPASEFYGEEHEWYEDLQGSIVFSIERDRVDTGTKPVDERTIVFFCRPKPYFIGALDEAENPVESWVYPELEAMLAVIDSYLGNLARLDFASVKLLGDAGGGRERQSRETGNQPTRRSAAPPPSEGGRPEGASAARPGPAPRIANGTAATARPAARTEGRVADTDIAAALSGNGISGDLDESLADSGGMADETPRF